MSSVILRAPSALVSPPIDTPYLLELDPRLLINLNAARFIEQYADGEPVGTAVATGAASLAERTFLEGDGWNAPILDFDNANGRPAFVFDGYARLTNVLGDFQFPIRSQPLTFIVVARVDVFSNNGSARIIGGSFGGTYGALLSNMAPSNAGIVSFTAGISTTKTVGTNLNVMSMVAAGTSSGVKINSGELAVHNLGTNGNAGIRIGGINTNLGDGSGLKGAVAQVLMFEGALTAAELTVWHDHLMSVWGIT